MDVLGGPGLMANPLVPAGQAPNVGARKLAGRMVSWATDGKAGLHSLLARMAAGLWRRAVKEIGC